MLGKSALDDSREPRGGTDSCEEPTRASGELQEERDLLVHVLGFGGQDLHFLELAALLQVQDMLCCFCLLVRQLKDGLGGT